jgi:hypothetical protein
MRPSPWCVRPGRTAVRCRWLRQSAHRLRHCRTWRLQMLLRAEQTMVRINMDRCVGVDNWGFTFVVCPCIGWSLALLSGDLCGIVGSLQRRKGIGRHIDSLTIVVASVSLESLFC